MQVKWANCAIPFPLRTEKWLAVFAPARPTLASDRVRFVGDNVAFVVAESRNEARSAAELIAIEYDPLPVTLDTASAIDNPASPIWDAAPDNTSYIWEKLVTAARRTSFSKGPNTYASCGSSINGLIAASLETRGAIGVYEDWHDRSSSCTRAYRTRKARTA